MYMIYHGYEYLMSCASITLADGGTNAANIYVQILNTHLCPLHWRAFPLHPFPVHAQTSIDFPVRPSLMSEAMRRGSLLCGPPAWEPNFNTVDFLLFLPLRQRNLRTTTTDFETDSYEQATGCVSGLTSTA